MLHHSSCLILQAWPQWRWHLDEMFVRINGKIHYLWRAVDHEGEALEAYVTKSRNRKAALTFLRKAMKRYGRPETIVTDKLGSYRPALRRIGNAARQKTGRWLNNRAEHSHQPLRRREWAMLRFRQMGCLQKFAAAHLSKAFSRQVSGIGLATAAGIDTVLKAYEL
jgi:putative transposase